MDLTTRNDPLFIDRMRSNMHIQQAVKGVNAMALLEYNRSAAWIAEALFPQSHPMYLAEKARVVHDNGILHLWGQLDQANQERLVDIAFSEFARDLGINPNQDTE